MPGIDEELVGRLLVELRELAVESGGGNLAQGLTSLVRFAREHDLLSPERASFDEHLREALGALREGLVAPVKTPPSAPAPDLRFYHPCIHVSEETSFYSFYAPLGRGSIARTRLLSCGRAGRVVATAEIDHHLPHSVAALEREAAAAPAQHTAPPEVLLSEEGKAEALELLRHAFPADIPFAAPFHMRRLRVWCLMTYLFPLLDRTPFLRVRVPDIRSARNVQALLERCCWRGLSVHRGDMASQVKRHRRVFAGTVIFGPEVKTGRLPRVALDHLEDLPATRRLEPPVAFVECHGDFLPPRVPEDWIVDVAMPAAVAPVNLLDGWEHLGCALALAREGALVREAVSHKGGVAEWLHRWLFGNLLVPTDEPDTFSPRSGELARKVEQVWQACLAEGEGEPPEHHCNVPCLRERLLARFPALRAQLEQPGWSAGFRRRLVEHGVVTYGVRNLTACLSRTKTEEWRDRYLSGVEVPAYRLRR